ncbi:MAG: phospho-sugar mutase [Myxococcota bacterium]|nr:phospho-sugar mutase [Myxococcota bacterium]
MAPYACYVFTMQRDDLRTRAEQWLEDDPDPTTRAELRSLLAHPDPSSTDLEDRFAATLEFGTAGLRGVLGAGPNRMNRAVVARATWGVASELLASVPRAAERGVVVGGDARRLSRELAEDAAAILAAAGLRVVLFSGPVPTPLVGFAVKTLEAAAGIVITASHNPPEYNGYKVYWEDAAQIVPPTDARIAAAIARAPPARAIARPPLAALRARGALVAARPGIARGYLAAVRALAIHPHEGDRSLRIVYTPLHGTGDALMRRALDDAGFTETTSVPEQRAPDGAFPTVAFPNPEEPGTIDLALALAQRTGAQLVLANDPDADRLAVAVPNTTPEGLGYYRLSGNDVGVLLGHYLLTERPAVRPRAVLASIVSSPLLGRIATSLGVRYEETLTGFKWIAHRSLELERQGYEVVFGYEEALGYCVGDVVHDKDGISAGVLVAELAAVLGAVGRTLSSRLEEIARRWGAHCSLQVSIVKSGASGADVLREMMGRLRRGPPRRIGDEAVISIEDYDVGTRRDMRTGEEHPLALPSSNVLVFHLASGSRIIARPSGTEPKAKFYFDVREEVSDDEPLSGAAQRASARLQALAGAFMAIATPPV